MLPGVSAWGSLVRRPFDQVQGSDLKLYAPKSNYQWPEDKWMRPGKLHITANMVRTYCDITARLLSLTPRIINKPPTQDSESRKRAEVIEQFFYRLLDDTGWDVWMVDWNLSGEVFGMKVLKPFWNNDSDAPDVSVIEQPQNLMLGYGTNDYSVVDWSIYRYTVSFIEAQSRWPDANIGWDAKGGPSIGGASVNWADGDKADIVNQRSTTSGQAAGGTPDVTMDNTQSHYEEYEQTQHLEVWDYWYRQDDKIWNAMILAGRVVSGPHEHPELPIIPYLVFGVRPRAGQPGGTCYR